MAQQFSFDVTTGADLQEVDNAVNQARKEVQQRYDFKGTNCTIDFDRAAARLVLEAPDEHKLRALRDVLETKMVRRHVPIRNLDAKEPAPASGGRLRQGIALQQGIPADTARQIVKDVKARGLKKVQVAIQGDELRVSSPSKDELQEVIAFLRSRDYGIQLRFGNYR